MKILRILLAAAALAVFLCLPAPAKTVAGADPVACETATPQHFIDEVGKVAPDAQVRRINPDKKEAFLEQLGAMYGVPITAEDVIVVTRPQFGANAVVLVVVVVNHGCVGQDVYAMPLYQFIELLKRLEDDNA